MPPPSGRYGGPQGLSNGPFGHLNPSMPQPNHMHQQHGVPQSMGGAHAGFGGGGGGGNLNAFGPGMGNAQLQAAFGGGPSGMGPGAGLGGRSGLESDAARMGFAHGAAMQQQQASMGAHSGVDAPGLGQPNATAKGMSPRIREVWKGNLEDEFKILMALIDQYPYVSMDTEFPGVVARPMGDFPSKASYHYQTVRCNVDLLKMIQLGITVFNADGELPPVSLDVASLVGPSRYAQSITVCPCTWTFNFQFDVDAEMCNEESISILRKAGCDFNKLKEFGVDPLKFGSLLTTSGLVYQKNVTWISFHGGYDFAYIFKQLWNQALPSDENKFRDLVTVCFPHLYDVKFLLRNAQQRVITHLMNHQHQRQANTPSNTQQNPHETTPTNPTSNAPPGPPPGLAISSTAIITHLGSKSGLQDLADELGCPRFGTQHTAGSDAWLTGSVFWSMRTRIFNGNIPADLNGQLWGLTGVGPPATSAQQQAVLAAQGQQNVMNGLGGYHSHGHRDGAPSTPTANSAAISGTPGRLGGMTPGGGFGNFSYGS